MGQVIVLAENEKLSKVIDIQMRTHLNISPIIKKTPKEVLELIQMLPDVELMIVQKTKENQSDIRKIDAFFSDNNKECHFFIFGSKTDLINPSNTYEIRDWRKLVDDVMSFMGVSSDEMDEKMPDYVAMPADIFIHFESIPHDLFLRMRTDSGRAKYVKRIPAHEKFDRSVIQGYMDKGVKDFYFEKEFRKVFSELLTKSLIHRLEKEYDSYGEKLEASGEVYDTVKDIVSELGIQNQIVEVCDVAMKAIVEDVKGADAFKRFIDSLKSGSKMSYQYKLIHMTSIICTNLIKSMKSWTSKDEQIKKLVFVSYFCDMFLADNDLLTVRDEQSLSQVDKSFHDHILKHAMRASELVRDYPDAPFEVDKIILQHHGQRNGVGFTKDIHSSISPLARLFFTAQEFSHRFLSGEYKKISEILESLEQDFDDRHIKEYVSIIKTSI